MQRTDAPGADNGFGRMRAHGVALLLCALVVALLLPGQAFAEVRKADVILDSTVDERGLSVAQCPSIDAEYAILVNGDGDVYFSRDSETPSQIASVTKVMTAIVAIDNAKESTYVAVSEAAATIGESSANLMQGDSMDFDSALKALLVPSGNDAAVALAETIGAQMIAANPSSGSDPVQVFVDAMNAKAREIGCTDTVYENPHGLDDGEFAGDLHSTAADQAKVARCAMGYQKIRDIVGGGTTSIRVDRAGTKETVELETTDELLEMYDAAIGIKTGYTELAGASFMGAASKDGMELYAVVLGSSDEQQRFVDAENMFEWAYDHMSELQLANSDEHTTMNAAGINGDVPVVAKVSHADWIDRTVPATLSDPDAGVSIFDLDGNVSQSMTFDELHGTVHAGDKVGKAVFKQRNEVIAEYDLVACETVEAPNPIETLSIGWQRFIGGFGGNPDKAESQVYNVMPIINNNRSNAA